MTATKGKQVPHAGKVMLKMFFVIKMISIRQLKSEQFLEAFIAYLPIVDKGTK